MGKFSFKKLSIVSDRAASTGRAAAQSRPAVGLTREPRQAS